MARYLKHTQCHDATHTYIVKGFPQPNLLHTHLLTYLPLFCFNYLFLNAMGPSLGHAFITNEPEFLPPLFSEVPSLQAHCNTNIFTNSGSDILVQFHQDNKHN